MILARRIAADMGEAHSLERIRFQIRSGRDRLDERRLVVASWKIESDWPAASPAIVAVALAKLGEAPLLGLLAPVFPRRHVFGDDRTSHARAITQVRSPTSYAAKRFLWIRESYRLPATIPMLIPPFFALAAS